MALSDTEIRKEKAWAAVAVSLLFVTPAGGKLWRWKYRFDGREKLMTFGDYPEVTLAQARERHIEARRLQTGGTDPMAERKAEKAAAENSFQSAARLWPAHWQDGKSPRHVDYVKRRIESDILPCLGSRPISAFEAPEVVALTKAIEVYTGTHVARRALKLMALTFVRTSEL